MTLLDAVILTGQGAAALALVVALYARALRSFAEARRARRVRAADDWRRSLIRAAMAGTSVPAPRRRTDFEALQSAFAQAIRRADPAFAERLRAATDDTGLEAFLMRRLLTSGNPRIRMEAAEALRWHPEGGTVLRQALLRDPLVQNRVVIARLLADRGERAPARVLGRALRLGSSTAEPAVHQALADADLLSDRALAHLEHSHRARSWLRITARSARRRRTPVGWPINSSSGHSPLPFPAKASGAAALGAAASGPAAAVGSGDRLANGTGSWSAKTKQPPSPVQTGAQSAARVRGSGSWT